MDSRTHQKLVLPYLLSEWAKRTPDRLFATFPNEKLRWTFGVAEAEVNRAANFLRSLGVNRGDVVALFDEASSHYIRLFLGALRIGAIVAPLNEAFRGNSLRHALNLCGARVLFCGAAYLDRLAELELPQLRRLIINNPQGHATNPAGKYEVRRAEELLAASDAQPETEPLHYWDPYAVIFTSGTTGLSKAVLSPYGQMHAVLKDNYLRWLGEHDVILSDTAMFHITGLLTLYCALYAGCSLVRYPKFSASEYWERVQAHGVTASTISKLEFLWNQPPREGEGKTTLRWMLTGQLPAYTDDWRRRFGVENVFTFFNMSEISAPLQSGVNPTNLRSAGRAREGVELRIVDENDFEVPQGSVGELLVRTHRPWEMSLGYLNNHGATVGAWRNGWFHTGDSFRRDADGHYYFVDRLKDSIRRKGENISSFEVEQEVLAHPSVLECAAVAAPSDMAGSDEVRAVVVLKPGQELTAGELWSFLEPRVPKYMLPRYLDFVDALPRNPTFKVLKSELRLQGVTASTWDRESSQPARKT